MPFGATIIDYEYAPSGEYEQTTVESTGTLDLGQYAQAYGTTVDGGTLDVFFGGYANGTGVYGGTVNVGYGGLVNGVTVANGGVLNVYGGGAADVDSAVNADVEGLGSSEHVFSGGMAGYSTINNFGSLTVDSGGYTHNMTLTNASNEYVYGMDAGATLSGQSMQIVEKGGFSWLAHAEGNSGLLVETGGAAYGTKLDKNCWMYVQGGGKADVVDFNGPNASLTFGDWHDSAGTTVAGFGMSDVIDFRGMCAGSGMSVTCTENAQNTAATLTLKDTFGQTTSLTLLGQYAGAEFSCKFDGNGGIAVTDQGYSLIGVLGGHLFA